MSVGKLHSMLENLRRKVIGTTMIKGAMLRLEGNGLSDPTIITAYNIESLGRTSVGVYRGVIQQSTFQGVELISTGIPTLLEVIAPSINTDAFYVRLAPVTGTDFDIEVFEVAQGLGNKIQYTPYDIIAGDIIVASLQLNGGDGSLPAP